MLSNKDDKNWEVKRKNKDDKLTSDSSAVQSHEWHVEIQLRIISPISRDTQVIQPSLTCCY